MKTMRFRQMFKKNRLNAIWILNGYAAIQCLQFKYEHANVMSQQMVKGISESKT